MPGRAGAKRAVKATMLRKKKNTGSCAVLDLHRDDVCFGFARVVQGSQCLALFTDHCSICNIYPNLRTSSEVGRWGANAWIQVNNMTWVCRGRGSPDQQGRRHWGKSLWAAPLEAAPRPRHGDQ